MVSLQRAGMPRFSGRFNTLWIQSGSAIDVIFTRSNITHNSVESSSSGPNFYRARLFRFDFCAILSNQGSEDCIRLGTFSRSSEVIQCLSIRSNDGSGSSSSSVFLVSGTKTINNSVIANNTNMGFGIMTGSGTLRFVNCYFDTFAFTWSGGNVITTGCVLGGDLPTLDPICVVPPTATFLPSASFADSFGGDLLSADFSASLPAIPTAPLRSVVVSAPAESDVNVVLIVGITVGVLVTVIACTICGVILYRRGKCRNFPLEEVDSETIFDTQSDVLQTSLITESTELEIDTASRFNTLEAALGL
jgi:hypothetical protein